MPEEHRAKKRPRRVRAGPLRRLEEGFERPRGAYEARYPSPISPSPHNRAHLSDLGRPRAV